jgi:hypothetical protein
MARIFTGGFESGDLLLDNWSYGETDLGAGSSPTSLPPAVSSSANEHRTLDGVNGGKFGGKFATSAGQKTMWVEQTLASNPSECYIRICMRRTTTGHSTLPVAFFYDNAGAFVGSLYLNRDASDRLSVHGNADALLALSSPGHTIVESATVFSRIEIHMSVSGGTFNIVELRVDDIPWPEMIVSGFGAGGSTGLGRIRILGAWNNQSGGHSSTVIIDDIAVNDTTGAVNNGFCGDGYVDGFKPNGVGTFSQLFNSAGDQVNNYSYVNTLPPSANGTNAVGTATPGAKDTYNVQDMPAPALGVNVVILSAYASKNGPAVSNATLVAIFDGVESDASPAALPTGSPNWFSRQFELDPNTGVPFTRSTLNGMEAGIQFS